MRKQLLMYAGLVSFLEQIMGDDYAIALFDLEDLKKPLVQTANFARASEKIMAKTSERITEKAPEKITGKASDKTEDYRAMLKNAAELPFDYLCGFEGLKEKIAVDKTAFFFIKDDDDNKIGALVFIRLYTEKADIRQVMTSVLRADSPSSEESGTMGKNGKTFGESDGKNTGNNSQARNMANESGTSDSDRIDSQIEAILLETVQEIYAPYAGKKLKKADKIDLMRHFFESGITKMRGGMNVIGEVTGISQASLYRYLMEVLEE